MSRGWKGLRRTGHGRRGQETTLGELTRESWESESFGTEDGGAGSLVKHTTFQQGVNLLSQ